uniref:Uncharacterized protein LOC109506727 n=1 Tax=Elaeis guineensis var. tenera TaxID=51953 RepID=A0A6J0PS16_ELAGV|nr:uncharacterized protein LOC109506727 [Elaeis guineensis]
MTMLLTVKSDEESSDSSFVESDCDLTDDDELFDKNVDVHGEVGIGTKTSKIIDNASRGRIDDDSETDYKLSDELRNVDGSSKDDSMMRKRFSEFRAETNMQNPQFEVGMLFTSMAEFRQAVREYSIKNRYILRMVKNEKDKVRAICKEGCPWLIYASWITDKKTTQVKRYDSKHTCKKDFKNIYVTSSWLAKKYLDRFRIDPKLSLTVFGETVTTDLHATIARTKLYRAKRKALRLFEGNEVEQYAKLWDYAAKFKKSDSGSTLLIRCNNIVFKILYVCLDACKRRFF